MKTKPLVVLCWMVVALASIHVGLNFVSLMTRPWFGFDYSRVTGRVRDVVPGGPAERAGLAIGDTIVSFDGKAVVVDAIPFYFAQAGDPVGVSFMRDGARATLSLVPISQEQMRRDQLRRGGRTAVLAVNNYLSIPLHLWILSICALLMIKRPGNKDARLAAAALASWAGGMFMARTPGFGALLDGTPQALHASLLLVDAFFVAGFFAFCLHLAIVFPSERSGAPRWIEALPYLLALPIAVELAADGLRRAAGEVSPAQLPWRDAYSNLGAFALAAALVTLAVRTLRMREPNPRRRLQLIFLSLLPGAATFILGFIVPHLGLSYAWDAAARLLHTPSVIAGSAIFAYAIVRHRMFNIRFLVRRSLQYALARGTLLVLMTLPLIGLAAFLYAHRRESLAVLLTGEPALYFLLVVPLALVARYRKRLLESVDRRFFREQYDARRLLLHVVSIVRDGSDMLVVSRVALDEIDRALHPRHVALWKLDLEGETLHRAFAQGETGAALSDSLDAKGTLASLLATTDEPLDVHSRQTRQLLHRLPEHDRAWLRATNAHLVVPLLIDGRLVGVMVLGERRSEEPYPREDSDLLRTLAAQLALALDYSRLKHSPSLVWSQSASSAIAALPSGEVLRICPRCGRCYEAGDARCTDDEQPLVVEAGVPRVIEDKYVVSRLLGRGGMGAVYLATQKRLNRPVAIKVLLAHLVGSTTMRSRFEREARIVARLRHPSIVTIHDFGLLPSGHAYLVMEHLDGDTLRTLMAKGPLPLEIAVPIIARIGEAVDAAHRAGVIHRDLKPENIIVVRGHDGAPSPRVLDFGLARMTAPLGDDEATLVQTSQSAGGVVGTLMYMAPEILSGHAADMRADQYSLAIIAYEMLTGEHPLGRATDLASVVRGHTETPMIPIRERVRVPPQVARSIDRALAKQPSARFESVGAFVGELQVPR